MRRGAILLAGLLCLLLPATTSAIPIHKHVTTYSTAYVPDAQGYRDRVRIPHEKVIVYDVAPPDSDDDGCPDSRDSYDGPGCNAPAPVAQPVSEPLAPTPTTTETSYSSGYSIPSSIVMCESGGDWGAVNLSSGAGGAYQILPSTWAAYGGSGAPQDASPAEQSAIAAQIYADSGGAAWVC